MATGKITVAAPSRKGTTGRQQEAFTRSLQRATEYAERSDTRATGAAQSAYQRASQFQLENIARVSEQTDAANERFLRSRLDQFEDIRKFENQQWERSSRLALNQRRDEREEAVKIKDTVARYNSIKDTAARYNSGVREQNLQAIASISETAGEVTQAVVKRHVDGIVKEEMALGMAEASQFGITPEQSQMVKAATGALAKAALEEGVTNDAQAEVDIAQAEDQRRSSPILTGWRAYGRALGRVQAAKGNWATALDVWIHSEDPVIPDPENPGQLISPRALARKGPAGTMAALRAGNAFLMTKFGLEGINPVIVAEQLSETVNGVTSALARNIITEDRAIDKQNQVEEITSQISTSYRGVDFTNTDQVTAYANSLVDRLAPLVGGRGSANEIVRDQLLAMAVANSDTNLLGGFETALISPTDPSLGTWGDRSIPEFDAAADAIIKRDEVENGRIKENAKELVNRIEVDWRGDLAEAGADTEKIEKANRDKMRRLLDVHKETDSPEALAILQEMQSRPLTHTDQAYSIVLEVSQKSGFIPSDTELQEMVDRGMMTEAQARDLAQRRGADFGGDQVQNMFNEIRTLTKQIFIEDIVQKSGLNSIQPLGSFGTRAANTLADETALHLADWINRQPRESLTTASIRQEATRYAKEAVKVREYQIKTKEAPQSPSEALSGKKTQVLYVGPVNDDLSSRITTVAPNPQSPSLRSYDLRGRRPEVVNGFMTTNDVVLEDQQIEADIQALKSGAPVSARTQAISRATGIPAAEVVRRQENLNLGTQSLAVDPYMNNPQAAQAAPIIPQEASLLTHPNVPTARVSRSVQKIKLTRSLQVQRLRNKEEQDRLTELRAAGRGLTDPPVSWTRNEVGGNSAIEAVRPLLNLLAEGESESSGNYDAVAGSGTGIAGLSNMTFGEARAQAGNRAIGRYQFVPKTMEAALKAAGLTMNDKFSPENQDRLAAAWILGGQRKALSAYIRGQSNDLGAAVNDAAFEWAALAGMTGAGKYDNDGVNKASISSGRVAQALQQVRRSYLESREAQGAASGATGFQITPTLRTLGGKINYVNVGDGKCTTNVLETFRVNGISNPTATGNDKGNNPRGAAVQFINDFNWKSLNIPGSRPITLNSTYGKAAVNQMSLQQYQQAVGRGQIPSGALVFQTRNSSWNGTADKSRGFDIAISRNGGSQLFNGRYLPSSVYGPDTTHVFVLVPSN